MDSTVAGSLTESTVVSVSAPAPGYVRAVLNNPPVNLFDPPVMAGLHLMREYVEDQGDNARVLVLESANPDFLIAHLDFPAIAQVPDIPGAQNIIQYWPQFSGG
jgi:hypothetical protein